MRPIISTLTHAKFLGYVPKPFTKVQDFWRVCQLRWASASQQTGALGDMVCTSCGTWTPDIACNTKFTYGQNEALITPLPSLEPKVINSGAQQSLFRQSSILAWSQGLLSALSGCRMRPCPLEMQAEQAHLFAKPCQAWAHICRVQTNPGALQEPPWFQQTYGKINQGQGEGLSCDLQLFMLVNSQHAPW